MRPMEWMQARWFRAVHGRNLVYNTCWEDPRLDREALRLTASDRVIVITSAGCNALDYLLDGPAEVTAIDVNPRQNALLELKREGIRNLTHDDFFQLFGTGRHPQFGWLYQAHLRAGLSPFAREYWDQHIRWFSGSGRRDSFYFRGSSGTVAWMLNQYIDRIAKVRPAMDAILNADSISEQRDIYHSVVKPRFWNRFLRWAIGRDSVLALLGVPKAQREEVERHHPRRVAGFIEDAIEAVFCDLPLKDNYFWRVYLTGSYTRECCPQYLTESGFEQLKSGLIDRLQIETSTLLDHLRSRKQKASRFVLLDHMDWLSSHHFHVLEEEWQALLSQATPDAMYLWRSGGLTTDYISRVRVGSTSDDGFLTDRLTFDRELAELLHRYDRVHTYGSFHIARPKPELSLVLN